MGGRIARLLVAVLALLFGFAQFGSAALADAPKRALRFGIGEGLSQVTVMGLVQPRDGRIWMATGEGITLYGGDRIEYRFRDEDETRGLRSDYVHSLFLDRSDQVWAGTSGGGASLFSGDGRFLTHLASGDERRLEMLDVFAFAEDAQGRVWAGSSRGIFVFRKTAQGFLPDAETARLREFDEDEILSLRPLDDGSVLIGTSARGLFLYDPAAEAPLALPAEAPDAEIRIGDAVRAIFQDREGRIWIGLSGDFSNPGGIRLYDREARRLTPGPVAFPEGIEGVMAIAQGEDGRLWFGSRAQGIFVADLSLDPPAMENYAASPWERHRLSHRHVRALMPDSTGRMWAGTWNGGVNSFSMSPDVFTTYYPDPRLVGYLPELTWALEEDETGALWIGADGGLARVDPETEVLERVELAEEIRGKQIWALLWWKGKLLLGVGQGSGLHVYDPQTRESRPALDEAGEPLLGGATIRKFLVDDQNRIWIGANEHGLSVYDQDLRLLMRHEADPRDSNSLPHMRIRGLTQTQDGRIWVGTSGGLSLYRPETNDFATYSGREYLPDDDVRAVHLAEDGRLYVATGGGLSVLRLNDAARDRRFIRQSEAFQSKMLYSLLPDKLGNLWIMTNNGLIRLDVSTGKERAFNTSDGLQSREFNFNAYKILRDGRIAIGGVSGVSIFDPSYLSTNPHPPRLSLAFMGRAVDPATAQSAPLDLGEEPRSIAFGVNVRHFDEAQSNRVSIRLDPLEKAPQILSGSTHEFHRDNLPMGEYTLFYSGVSSSGVETETASYRFSVRKAFYARWYMLLAYGLLGLVALSGLIFLRTRQIRRRAADLEATVVEQTRELRAKSQRLEEHAADRARFYARAAHDIRTPLSLIRAPVQELLAEEVKPETRQNLARVVQHASNRLMQLTEEMMSVSREGGSLRSGRTVGDARAFLEEICRLYAESAKAKGLGFSYEIQAVRAATFESGAAETILHNLLSNAVEHREPPVQIRLDAVLREGALEIRISDDGPPLPEDLLRRLENFRDVVLEPPPHRGSEIVAAAVLKAGGELSVDRAANEIRAILPAEVLDAAGEEEEQENDEDLAEEDEDRRILIVEDDRELRNYLVSLISQVAPVKAVASIAAAKRAMDRLPIDLVVCDVMLPDGLGFEFASYVKNQEDLSHAQLVILTALTDLSSYRQALEVWADDYLTKPFAPEELLAKIRIRLRAQEAMRLYLLKRLRFGQEQFGREQEEGEEPQITRLSPQDVRLDECFRGFVAANLANADADLGQAALVCGVSRRSLQRKLTALYGKSFSELMNIARMEKARELLAQGAAVGEVAKACGYRNLASFSRQFKATHDLSPSEFAAKDGSKGERALPV